MAKCFVLTRRFKAGLSISSRFFVAHSLPHFTRFYESKLETRCSTVLGWFGSKTTNADKSYGTPHHTSGHIRRGIRAWLCSTASGEGARVSFYSTPNRTTTQHDTTRHDKHKRAREQADAIHDCTKPPPNNETASDATSYNPHHYTQNKTQSTKQHCNKHTRPACGT